MHCVINIIKNNHMRITFFFLLISLAVYAKTQEKTEKEQRIRKKYVPDNARKWLNDTYEGFKKVKWYHELSSGKVSYEAKLKYRSQHHSVEFDSLGVIEDIEVRYTWAQIANNAKENMNHYFNKYYSRYEVRKIQKQYTGLPDDLEDLIDEDEMENIEINYEIIFYGKNSSGDNLWEGLFDEKGKFIKKRKINIIPTENLEF